VSRRKSLGIGLRARSLRVQCDTSQSDRSYGQGWLGHQPSELTRG
jgi:hypothetical protein